MVPLNSTAPGVSLQAWQPRVRSTLFYKTSYYNTELSQTNPFPPSGSIAPSLGGPAPLPQAAPGMALPGFGANTNLRRSTRFGAQPTFNPAPNYGYPGYNGAAPSLPGVGQSGILGTYPYTNPSSYPPSAFPNSSPSALFPGAYPQGGYGYNQGGNWFSNWFGNNGGWNGATYGQPGISTPGGLVLPPGGNMSGWNPPGSVFGGNSGYPGVIRLFQGPRFRHAWIYGSNDDDALQVNDSDIALAFAIPSFLYSTQPLYLLPSVLDHQWEGPRNTAADLPGIAYSAFLELVGNRTQRASLAPSLGFALVGSVTSKPTHRTAFASWDELLDAYD